MASSMATMAATSMGNMVMGTQTSMAGAMPSATAAMSDSMDMGMGSCKIDVSSSRSKLDLGIQMTDPDMRVDAVELEHRRRM